jgi:putative ABC transport system substrate-binding protein
VQQTGGFWRPVGVLSDEGRIADSFDVAARCSSMRALDGIAQKRNAGLIVLPDTFTVVHRHRIVQLANKHSIPAVYAASFFATAGGLMSYGSDVADVVRSTGTYVGRILRGASPGELPVQTSTKYELVINLKTAKALGLEVQRCSPAPTR